MSIDTKKRNQPNFPFSPQPPKEPGQPSAERFAGQPARLVDRVVNRLDPAGNVLLGTSLQAAEEAVRRGDIEAIQGICGQFAILQQSGKTIRMARSIGRPMRYFLAKRTEGPALIVAERMDEIREQLRTEGLVDQFRAEYTRMVPAHHLLELQLVGCPDPNPKLIRYFAPQRNRLPADIRAIGRQYIGKLAEVCDRWLETLPDDEPIGVMFSGGVDSGSIVLVLDYLLRRRGQSSSRLKAFTLCTGEDASDPSQARQFLQQVNLSMLLETVQVSPELIR
ncbi:MAG: asparagine synthase-related protein, partial [Planctomycetota bacterium]